MPRIRILSALLSTALTAAVLAGTSPAIAHQRAALSVVSPAEGALVGGDRVEVVVAAQGGELAGADFTMQLDGQPVDTSGAVGVVSLFTTFSLTAGKSTTVRVAVAQPGEHELRLVYGADGDDPQPDVVRRFRTSDVTLVEPTGSRWTLLLVVAVTTAAVLGAAVLVRRRRRPPVRPAGRGSARSRRRTPSTAPRPRGQKRPARRGGRPGGTSR